MFCTKCGNQLPENSKFCKYCGSPVRRNQSLLGEPAIRMRMLLQKYIIKAVLQYTE